ncbi:MAG: tetratricopeptide repeat protein [Opitutaceae bacterium]
MTKSDTPSPQKPSADDRNLVAVDENYVGATFEDKVQRIWVNYRMPLLAGCALVVLAFVAKGGWDYIARQKELDIEKAYVAATTPEQLKTFAAAHANHSLAGIAQLRIADDAYAAGKSADALAGYEQAIAAVKDGPLAARARLGLAMAKIQSGKASDGTADLKQLADDAKRPNAVRAEAHYQLSSLAAEAGDAAEVQKYSEQLMKLDPSSPWTQRALALRATLPAPAPSAEPMPPAKSDSDAAPQIKLPGK